MSGVARILFSLVVIVLIAAGIAVGSSASGRCLRRPKSRLRITAAAVQTGVPGSLARLFVQRGEYLAKAADCMVAHRARRQKYAGGLGFKLPFGTLYSTTSTPTGKPASAITATGFSQCVKRGKRHDGAMLYPAMPYTSHLHDGRRYARDQGLSVHVPSVRAARPPIHYHFRSTSAGRCCLVGAVQSGHALCA